MSRMTHSRLLLASSTLALALAGGSASAAGTETTPTEAPAAGPVVTASTPAEGGETAADINQELLSMEEQVDALKEQVFRSKATLQLLKEIVVSDTAGSAGLVVNYHNKLGGGYTVESIAYLLDGQARFSKDDPSGALTTTRDLKILESAVAPGSHTLQVEIRLRPTGYKLFQYAKDYLLDVRSSYAFEVSVGKTCNVSSELNEHSAAQSFEERAKVDFEMRCERSANATSH